ncbi:MAG: phosphohydrolase, partial [Clostridia bacterium]|nr:phosphohydrolase [Clostridia bacterium]
MTDRIQKLFMKMIDFDRDADLIQHFTKVHDYCKLIASLECVDGHTAEVLEAAALVHDIGIPVCNQKYGSHPGNLQEKEGPPLARQ